MRSPRTPAALARWPGPAPPSGRTTPRAVPLHRVRGYRRREPPGLRTRTVARRRRADRSGLASDPDSANASIKPASQPPTPIAIDTEPDPPHGGVHLVHGLRDPNRSYDGRNRSGRLIDDRNGRSHDVDTEVLTEPDHRRRDVFESGGDLGPLWRRVVHTRRRPLGVGDQAAGRIDDDHAAVGHLGRATDERLKRRPPVGSEVLCADVLGDRSCSHEVLTLELGTRAAIERDRERDRERDDDRHGHVGERRYEAGPDLRRGLLSGPVRDRYRPRAPRTGIPLLGSW